MQQPLPLNVEAMFDYSLTMLNQEKTWIEELVKKLEGNI